METDFLNFHDEEHFSSALYQNDLLDDSQSSLLDIVGDYRHEEYADNVAWDQDVERELNGDLAVIPMSGQINTFPKLSNSPPSKDFQKIFSDWQHLSSIEATTSEDLNSDLHLSNPIDMLDCFQPATVSPTITIAAGPVVSSQSSPKSTSIISSFDFSNTQIPIKKEIKTVRKIGGKNLELLKKVIKEENESFKTDLNSSDELDPSNFDITSYVNGDDDLLIKKEINDENDLEIIEKDVSEPQADLFEPELNNDKPVKTCKKDLFGMKSEIKIEIFDQKDKNKFKKLGGFKTIENIKEEKKIEDPEEDVDVETVSEQIPVLEARDLNSLLEQFEATEAVNPIFDSPTSTNQNPTKIPTPDCKKQITNDPKQKVKQLNSELKQPNKQKTVSVELLQKIRASATKKTVNVIPARPSKKIKTKIMVDKCKIQKSLNEMIQIDHDYCSTVKSDANIKKINSNDVKLDEDNKKIIDDTAIRIGKQIKNAINNENLKKPLKKEKVMISLLKTNFNKNTIINTINTNDEKIQNIIVTENSNCKKRKLNLEEYKKLRGEILKSSDSSRQNSPLTSGTNSPLPQTKTAEYQELIMKMASEILKTNAKQTKQPTIETKLDEFILPEIKIEKTPPPEVSPPKINENYQMKTIVSIGVNTNECWLKTIEQKPPKNKIDEIITPILQNTNCKINSNSLIANITETLMQQSPKISPRNSPKTNDPQIHGEDKTVIILNKNEEKPVCRSIGVQTDKICRNYRQRRDSSSSSDESNKKTPSLINSSISSYSRSRTKSRSKSRSRSRSRSSSQSEYSSYSSDSSRSRSKSRSVSPRRFSRNRYRSRRSRSNSYRASYRHSRSPYSRSSRSRSRRRRERESIERERMREVEERRVIYVGKINDDTTRADLRRRFQNFGPITNVSVHFREHGDNYGFVTFAYKMDAYEAVERGNEDPNMPKYDISFGGRRAFCKTRYSDLDNIEAESMNSAPIFRRDEDSFDILLREVQAKLRKRKV